MAKENDEHGETRGRQRSKGDFSGAAGKGGAAGERRANERAGRVSE